MSSGLLKMLLTNYSFTILHYIVYKGWHAIKTNQPTNQPTDQPTNQLYKMGNSKIPFS